MNEYLILLLYDSFTYLYNFSEICEKQENITHRNVELRINVENLSRSAGTMWTGESDK